MKHKCFATENGGRRQMDVNQVYIKILYVTLHCYFNPFIENDTASLNIQESGKKLETIRFKGYLLRVWVEHNRIHESTKVNPLLCVSLIEAYIIKADNRE